MESKTILCLTLVYGKSLIVLTLNSMDENIQCIAELKVVLVLMISILNAFKFSLNTSQLVFLALVKSS